MDILPPTGLNVFEFFCLRQIPVERRYNVRQA